MPDKWIYLRTWYTMDFASMDIMVDLVQHIRSSGKFVGLRLTAKVNKNPGPGSAAKFAENTLSPTSKMGNTAPSSHAWLRAWDSWSLPQTQNRPDGGIESCLLHNLPQDIEVWAGVKCWWVISGPGHKPEVWGMFGTGVHTTNFDCGR